MTDAPAAARWLPTDVLVLLSQFVDGIIAMHALFTLYPDQLGVRLTWRQWTRNRSVARLVADLDDLSLARRLHLVVHHLEYSFVARVIGLSRSSSHHPGAGRVLELPFVLVGGSTLVSQQSKTKDQLDETRSLLRYNITAYGRAAYGLNAYSHVTTTYGDSDLDCNVIRFRVQRAYARYEWVWNAKEEERAVRALGVKRCVLKVLDVAPSYDNYYAPGRAVKVFTRDSSNVPLAQLLFTVEYRIEDVMHFVSAE